MATFEEVYNKNVASPGTATSAATTSAGINPGAGTGGPTATATGVGFNEAFTNYQGSDRGKTVGGMYDAQTNSGLTSLKNAYEQNLSDAQAARGNIDVAYRGNANSMAANYERQRRNNNLQAAGNGLNTGTASQMQLAQSSAYQRDYGNLMGQYGRDVSESERAMANLKATYQNAIAQAQADGDYKRMAALLDDYNKQYDAQLQQAALLAQYGDFSGYAGIPGYDQGQIDNMRNVWIAQNPLLAYNTGAIDAATYKKMTGQNPPGVGGGGSGYYRSGKKKPTGEPAPEPTATPKFNPGTGNAGYIGSGSGRRVIPINTKRNERA